MSQKFSLLISWSYRLFFAVGCWHCSRFPGARLEGPEGPSEVVLVQSQTLYRHKQGSQTLLQTKFLILQVLKKNLTYLKTHEKSCHVSIAAAHYLQ